MSQGHYSSCPSILWCYILTFSKPIINHEKVIFRPKLKLRKKHLSPSEGSAISSGNSEWKSVDLTGGDKFWEGLPVIQRKSACRLRKSGAENSPFCRIWEIRETKIITEGLIIPPLPMQWNQDLKHKWDLELLEVYLIPSAEDGFQLLNKEQGRL